MSTSLTEYSPEEILAHQQFLDTQKLRRRIILLLFVLCVIYYYGYTALLWLLLGLLFIGMRLITI